MVVNADSLQLYGDLGILTARPGPAELRLVPHRLYGILPGDARCSAGDWRRMALGEIGRCGPRLPVVVGGSGLYLEALTRGLHRIPRIPPRLRAALGERLRTEGPAALHSELEERDPASAARLEPGDGQRVVRALEVLAHTGRGLAAWRAGSAPDPEAGVAFFTIAVMPPRETLYAACDRRFGEMLAAGVLAEVEAFAASDPPADCPLWKAVGARTIARHLAGGIAREEMGARVRRETRNYAKRQLTWFRNRLAPDLACDGDAAHVLPEIRRFLLTCGR